MASLSRARHLGLSFLGAGLVLLLIAPKRGVIGAGQVLTSENRHSRFRKLIAGAFERVFGRPGSQRELDYLQAVSLIETGYGEGWFTSRPGARESNNLGAITAGSGWTGATFEYYDQSPGKPRELRRFRAYPTLEAGAEDLVRAVYVWRGRDAARVAAVANDVDAFSRVLRETVYYEGTQRDPEDAIRAHAKRMREALRTIRAEINEGETVAGSELEEQARELAAHLLKSPRKGTESRKLVASFQRAAGLDADGLYGPLTALALAGYGQCVPPAPRYWPREQEAKARFRRQLASLLEGVP